ncbi:hypothetical protein KI387_008238, partial [Taxus chinensis]
NALKVETRGRQKNRKSWKNERSGKVKIQEQDCMLELWKVWACKEGLMLGASDKKKQQEENKEANVAS